MCAPRIALPVLVLLALVCFTTTGQATTWNVPGQAPTIQAGIDSASAGDTVSVASGTYTWMTEGTGTSNGLITMKNGVCLRSAAGEPDSVIIDSQLSGRVIYMSNLGSGTVLEGLTITGGTTTLYGGGMLLYRSDPVIRNCYITGNQCTQWSSRGNGMRGEDSSPTIENCVFSHNIPTAGDGMGGAADFYYYSYPTFTSCTFYANTASSGCHITSNVGSSATLDRCILAFGIDGEAADCYSNGTITMTCCNVYGNEDGDWTECIRGQDGVNGNFSADPLFCDAPGGDLRLMTASPCLDAPGCGPVGAFGHGCRRTNYWYVPFDVPTIQAAVDSAAHGDTIVVACGTYYENVLVDVNVTIMSETGEPDCAIIDGQSLGRVIEFNYHASATPRLEGFTITGGSDSVAAGIYCNDSSPEITNCIVTDNAAVDIGGGIVCATGTPVIRDCIIKNNSAGMYSGGAGSFGSTATFENCTFYGNDAPLGGCFYASGTLDTLSNCILSFSTQGDAVHCGAGLVVMSCCNVYGNAGGDYQGCIAGDLGVNGNFSADPAFCHAEGGDLHLHWTSPCISAPGCGQVGALGLGCLARTWYVATTGSDSTGDGTAGNPFATIQYGLDRSFWGDTVEVACGTYFEHDIALKSGVLLTSATGTWDCVIVDAQGISRAFLGDVLDGTTAVIGFTVKHGRDTMGGGMYLQYSDITVTNCKFDSCHATQLGGGAAVLSSSPTFTSCFFYADTAQVGGGLCFSACTPTVEDCIFSGNHSGDYGGGLCLSECTGFDVSVCSAELNTATYGGGVQVFGGSGTFDHCGFRSNTATSDGGGIHASDGASIAVTNSFVYGNYVGGYGGGVMCTSSSLADIAATTFYGNTAVSGGGCVAGNSAALDLDNTIIAFSGGGGAVECTGGGTADLACCDVYGNTGGDWSGCIAGQDTADNISADPLFCNPEFDDFHLAPYSPCLTGPCGQIGALGVGVDCYYELPMIVGVTDVGNDQGKQARLKWRRSIYDVPGNDMDINGYTLFRRQDANLMVASAEDETVVLDATADAGGDMPILGADGWDQIGYVLAYGDSVYQTIVPTLCDSTDQGICWSVFMVRATSSDPFTYFDSDPDSGYSIDNLAPAPPPGLMMTSETELAWEDVPDVDFDYYSVYGSDLDVLDETGTLIGYTIATMKDVTGHVYDYYYVTATDFSGNEGEESSVSNVFAGVPEIGDIPTAFALRQNRPNPFSATTVIGFDLPEETGARIRIYDTHGRIIIRLTDSNYEAGRHAVTWRGEDQAGNQVSPGVYFVRMEAGEFEAMRKVLLLR